MSSLGINWPPQGTPRPLRAIILKDEIHRARGLGPPPPPPAPQQKNEQWKGKSELTCNNVRYPSSATPVDLPPWA